MKYLIFLLIAFIVSSCSKDPMRSEITVNRNFQVDLLFEHEGCKVFRFVDAGNRIYYTDCSSTMWEQPRQCGKTPCNHRMEVPNSGKKNEF